MTPLEALRGAADRGVLPRGASALIAVSGGADSLCLLHAAAELAGELGWTLAVGHVHHGWPERRREADRDLAFVAEHARRLGLAFLSRRRDARAAARRDRVSPEAAARRVRYEALLGMAREVGAGLVATAHHADDRLETYLLAKDRRGGVASLGGVRERRADGVVRPLLAATRGEIEADLARRGLAWRRDATNGDLRLARNAVRRRIAEADAPTRARWEEEARVWAGRREALDAEFERRVAPGLRDGARPRSVVADAEFLAALPEELLRRAVEEAARPFARPGRPPMTGRERETLVARLGAPGDFRFEAGRRIAVRRRGRTVSFSLRAGAARTEPVYDIEPDPLR